MTHSLARLGLLSLSLCALVGAVSCGGASAPRSLPPFIAGSPDTPGGGGTIPPLELPPPTYPTTPVWSEDAVPLGRTATFGSFPSDLVRFHTTLFTTDADAIEATGARIVPVDVSGAAPIPSSVYAVTTVTAANLVDSAGGAGDLAAPIGFGFFVNDLAIASGTLGFALVNAGGSDSSPTLANLVVFDPTTGSLRAVVNLANDVPAAGMLDSSGAAIAGGHFVQSQAEGVEYVPLGGGRGRLFVAMANILVGSPSFGAVKCPGTIQVFEVDESAGSPVSATPTPPFATRTLFTHDFNPSAVTRITTTDGQERVLVTEAGTTAYDASFRLVPATPASVEAYDAKSLALLGRFDLGLVGLSGIRPAVGRDGGGHLVAFLASSVLGEVYLLRLDGLSTPFVDAAAVAVLRGRNNPIPIDPAQAGGPGGNVAGLALSTDGRTLLASGFGDFFAFPSPLPGRLYALALPEDLVTSPNFAREFVPGTTQVVATPGRALGPVVIVPPPSAGPEVLVSVSGSVSTTTFLGTGPASVGSLQTFGQIR